MPQDKAFMACSCQTTPAPCISAVCLLNLKGALETCNQGWNEQQGSSRANPLNLFPRAPFSLTFKPSFKTHKHILNSWEKFKSRRIFVWCLLFLKANRKKKGSFSREQAVMDWKLKIKPQGPLWEALQGQWPATSGTAKILAQIQPYTL